MAVLTPCSAGGMVGQWGAKVQVDFACGMAEWHCFEAGTPHSVLVHLAAVKLRSLAWCVAGEPEVLGRGIGVVQHTCTASAQFLAGVTGWWPGVLNNCSLQCVE